MIDTKKVLNSRHQRLSPYCASIGNTISVSMMEAVAPGNHCVEGAPIKMFNIGKFATVIK